MRAEFVVEESCAPCSIEKAGQHAPAGVENGGPKPREVVLKVLFVAEKSGPASVSRVGVPEIERRSERMPPDVSTPPFVKLRKGWALVLRTWLPSPMNRKLNALAVGLPLVMFDCESDRSGPASVMPEPFTSRMKFCLALKSELVT